MKKSRTKKLGKQNGKKSQNFSILEKLLLLRSKHLVLGIFTFFLSLFALQMYVLATQAAYTAEYFNNRTLSGSPVFTRNDTEIDFSWGSGSPDPSVTNDDFSSRWTRTVDFAAGTYYFSVTADDGVRLFIDNELVLDKWIDQPPTTYTVSKTLAEGEHTIKMEYYERGGGATAKLSWTQQAPPPPPPPASESYTGEYFNNTSLSGVPSLTRTDSTINFDWGSGSPDPSITHDNFSTRWIRTIDFEEGNYTFSVTADDGFRVYVDNQLVLDKWVDQPPTTYTFTQTLAEGEHTIKMEYYERGGGATAKLSWTFEGTPPPPPPASESFTGEYFNNTSFSGTPILTRNDATIDFDWGSGSPHSSVQSDNFSVKWLRTLSFEEGNYTFTTTADDGVRVYIDNELLIDQWKDQAPTTYTANKTVSAGDHTIRMEYYEKGGGATAKLSWVKENTSSPPPSSETFVGQYFNNISLSGTPALTRNDAQVDFKWTSGTSPDPVINDDNFSVRWVRTLDFIEGSYEFIVTGDDGVRLYIDEELVINQWKDQPPTTYTTVRQLTGGSHTIKLEYYERGGGATAKLSWIEQAPVQSPSIAEESFSIIVLPDTQKYAASYQHINLAQTNWIKNNVSNLDIRYVLHEGDLVDSATTISQWDNAKQAMDILDGVIPYAIALGNHDFAGDRDSAIFNSYFPLSKFQSWPTFGGTFESGKMDNVYHLFSADGIDFLVLSLEFGPRDSVLTWADQVVQNHSERKVILLTHDYIYDDNTLHGSCSCHVFGPDDPVYGLSNKNTGIQVWEKFVRKHPNMLFTFSGHVHQDDGAGRLVGIGNSGNRVYQMFANYQHYLEGGQGYLRIIEINPVQKSVSVQTYSPYLNAYLTDSAQQFAFTNVTELDVFTPDPNSGSLTATISTGSDDAEEGPDGSVYLTSSDLELTDDPDNGGTQTVGMRFSGLNIPQGATITNAYIQFTVDETNSRDTSLTFHAEKTAHSETFTSTANDISSRMKTSASTSWNLVSPWSAIGDRGDSQKTPSLTSLVQEIISDGSWSSGSAMSFIITGSGKRVAYSYERVPFSPPSLVIEWTTAP